MGASVAVTQLIVEFMDDQVVSYLFSGDCEDGTYCSWKKTPGWLIVMGHRVTDRQEFPLVNVRRITIRAGSDVVEHRKACARNGQVRTASVR
jgi:hypothetical protein